MHTTGTHWKFNVYVLPSCSFEARMNFFSTIVRLRNWHPWHIKRTVTCSMSYPRAVYIEVLRHVHSCPWRSCGQYSRPWPRLDWDALTCTFGHPQDHSCRGWLFSLTFWTLNLSSRCKVYPLNSMILFWNDGALLISSVTGHISPELQACDFGDLP